MTVVLPIAEASPETDADLVLSVKGVSKKFCRSLRKSLWYGVQDIAAELLGASRHHSRLRDDEFWALKDVSFELRRGEALGLVGANGAGKTTLLRIINGLIKPDEGEIKVHGRTAPLIALGAGFNPILTGRENIYVNMSILGLTKQEIDDCFEEVVAFAEIGEALDAPVQSYSSGMIARLGFACAIHVVPEILLIDEVLSVGDLRFRDKCARKLQDIRNKKTAFILVSHSSTAILALCERCIYLRQGEMQQSGNTYEVIRKYEQDVFIPSVEVNQYKFIATSQDKDSIIHFTYIIFRDTEEREISTPLVGQSFAISIGCRSLKSEKETDIVLGVLIRDLSKDNNYILFFSNVHDNQTITLYPGDQEIRIQLDNCSLRAGIYEMDVYLQKKPDYRFDTVLGFRFKIEDNNNMITDMSKNLFYQPRRWIIKYN